jgi:hypothetical protein
MSKHTESNVAGTDLILGGYFLAKPTSIPNLERVPRAGFLTVSKCLAEFVPDDWVYWDLLSRRTEMATHADALGIDTSRLEDLKTWCTFQSVDRKTLGYPNVIFDLGTAESLMRLFDKHRRLSWVLLGIGLPFRLSGEYFRRLKEVTTLNGGVIPLGVPTMLERGLYFPDGEEPLGFDALGYESKRGTFHSSKCFQVEIAELRGIAFKQFC